MARARQRLWAREGHSPRGDSGSVSRPPPGTQWALVPRQPLSGEPLHIPTLLTRQCRQKPQAREGLTAQGHTMSESFWHLRLPTQGPKHIRRHLELQWDVLTELRLTEEATGVAAGGAHAELQQLRVSVGQDWS